MMEIESKKRPTPKGPLRCSSPPALSVPLAILHLIPPASVFIMMAFVRFAFPMMPAAAGNLDQPCGIELAMQPFAGRIDRMDEVASILDANGDVLPAFGFKLGDQGFARLPVGERRRAVPMRVNRASAGEQNDKGHGGDAHLTLLPGKAPKTGG